MKTMDSYEVINSHACRLYIGAAKSNRKLTVTHHIKERRIVYELAITAIAARALEDYSSGLVTCLVNKKFPYVFLPATGGV